MWFLVLPRRCHLHDLALLGGSLGPEERKSSMKHCAHRFRACQHDRWLCQLKISRSRQTVDFIRTGAESSTNSTAARLAESKSVRERPPSRVRRSLLDRQAPILKVSLTLAQTITFSKGRGLSYCWGRDLPFPRQWRNEEPDGMTTGEEEFQEEHKEDWNTQAERIKDRWIQYNVCYCI